MVAVRNESDSFRIGLDGHGAPNCLKTVDVELRAALAAYRAGADLAKEGIDASDNARIEQGAAMINDGNAHLEASTAALKAANC
jgi:hypothetical protein